MSKYSVTFACLNNGKIIRKEKFNWFLLQKNEHHDCFILLHRSKNCTNRLCLVSNLLVKKKYIFSAMLFQTMWTTNHTKLHNFKGDIYFSDSMLVSRPVSSVDKIQGMINISPYFLRSSRFLSFVCTWWYKFYFHLTVLCDIGIPKDSLHLVWVWINEIVEVLL